MTLSSDFFVVVFFYYFFYENNAICLFTLTDCFNEIDLNNEDLTDRLTKDENVETIIFYVNLFM